MTTISVARFFAKVRKTSNCWLWIASIDKDGYGWFAVSGKIRRASRVSWMIHHGDIPDGLKVLHSCDNPGCVNPEHLFLGTCADNSKDMVSKGRQATGDRHGSRTHPDKIVRLGRDRHGMAKLTTEQVTFVLKIWSMGGLTQKRIANMLCVSHSTISAIVNGLRK